MSTVSCPRCGVGIEVERTVNNKLRCLGGLAMLERCERLKDRPSAREFSTDDLDCEELTAAILAADRAGLL